MTADRPALISEDNAAFIQQGVSINVASRDVRHVPSLTRALACRLDGGRVRILLLASQCGALLRDIERCGQVAAVFSQPSTHRTLQIKGSDARLDPPGDADRACLAATEAAFARDLMLIGFDRTFVRRMFTHDPDDLRALVFTPADVFHQSPGPRAGERIAGGA